MSVARGLRLISRPAAFESRPGDAGLSRSLPVDPRFVLEGRFSGQRLLR